VYRSPMGKFVLGVLLFVAACSGGGGGGDDTAADDAPLARCGDGHVDANEQCDDGNAIAGDGCTLCMIDAQRMAAIDATWELTTVAGATAACPSGVDSATVSALPVDSNGTPTGPAIGTQFDCSAGMGTTTMLPAARYSASVTLSDHGLTQVYGVSASQMIDLSDATNKPLDATFLTDGGKFQLAWKLVKMSDGTTVTCADVGTMPRVKVGLTPDMGTSSVTTFSCDVGSAATSAVLAGSYMVAVSITTFNGSTMTIGTATPLTGQVIVAPNGLTDLATITIPITAL
jgi:cysteine-rich repeat protein